MNMWDENIEKVRSYAISHAKMGENSIHGIDHWDRVARNGESLHVPEADMAVVLSFAYLHDVERDSDGYDEEHGPGRAIPPLILASIPIAWIYQELASCLIPPKWQPKKKQREQSNENLTRAVLAKIKKRKPNQIYAQALAVDCDLGGGL